MKYSFNLIFFILLLTIAGCSLTLNTEKKTAERKTASQDESDSIISPVDLYAVCKHPAIARDLFDGNDGRPSVRYVFVKDSHDEVIYTSSRYKFLDSCRDDALTLRKRFWAAEATSNLIRMKNTDQPTKDFSIEFENPNIKILLISPVNLKVECKYSPTGRNVFVTNGYQTVYASTRYKFLSFCRSDALAIKEIIKEAKDLKKMISFTLKDNPDRDFSISKFDITE